MTLEQGIITLVVALISAAGGIRLERIRDRREREKLAAERADKLDASTTDFEKVRLETEIKERQLVQDASREIRDFLRGQVAELNDSIDKIEVARAGEREKWHQMLAQLSTNNLELELQHRRNMARIQELEEEAKAIDNHVRELRTRIVTLEGNAIVMAANLDRCERENRRLRKEMQAIPIE